MGKSVMRNQQFTRLMAVGMMLLALAGVVSTALRHHAFLSESAGDGVTGLLYGLAIGCIFLGFQRRKRGCASS
jgi:heme/copper-type cytochrome/quinol oxidase subunit 3